MVKRYKRFRFFERLSMNRKVVATAYQRFSIRGSKIRMQNKQINIFCENIYARINGRSSRGRYPQL
ncbi:hypothetical protein GF359_04735 [candidate division WOR-3 bacterium]|uniref:Uncharacterized protein n=1 Tax=candidate division WOR-3 bacterium TaxID=2052148 RepID=A0A9D5K8V3_UNCW3|nr:hypothetical protein [candidate division WOR-3 bacterium]MBD3364501.1 hypothetical protein [candidate division WOR-3 bacterium]